MSFYLSVKKAITEQIDEHELDIMKTRRICVRENEANEDL